jgi:hypothetical protein
MFHHWDQMQNYCTYPRNTNENLALRDKKINDMGASTDIMIILEGHHDFNKNNKKDIKVVTFETWAGEGCEGSNFYFVKDKNGWCINHYFTKTQYATEFLRCHLLIIQLLDMFVELGFEVTVKDEGHYWETRDLTVLAKEINDYTDMLSSLSHTFKQMSNGKMDVEAMIDKSKNYVVIKEEFKKGSGCYNCIKCGKQTRATGIGDAASVGLCQDCYNDCENHNEEIDRK